MIKYQLTTKNIIKTILIMIIVVLVYSGLKLIINEPRPIGATAEGSGFPSGHTAFAFALVALIGTNPFTLAIASIVGLERITSHNHTLFQVVAGGLIGYFLALWLNKVINF